MSRAMFALPDGAPTLSRAAAAQRIAARDPAVMVPFWADMLVRDHRETVARMDIPCLALHGAQSRIYDPATAQWLAQTAPQGSALVLPDVGHAPILEAPQACAAAISAFLKDLS